MKLPRQFLSSLCSSDTSEAEFSSNKFVIVCLETVIAASSAPDSNRTESLWHRTNFQPVEYVFRSRGATLTVQKFRRLTVEENLNARIEVKF